MQNSNSLSIDTLSDTSAAIDQSLLHSLPLAFVALDTSFLICEFSQPWLQLMGIVMEREINPADIYSTDYRTEFDLLMPLVHELERVLDGERAEPWIVQVHKHNTDEHWVKVNCSTWTRSDGTIAGAVAVFHDITSLSKTEQLLRIANEELLQFNYHISHDLVAPISSARGLLTLMQSDLEANELTELPEMLNEAGQQLVRLDRLVVDLMSLARADARANELTAFELTPLIDEIAAALTLKSREIDISVSLNFDLPRVVTDRVRLQQILTNLISNAKKFNDPSEPNSAISISSCKQGNEVIIRVSDNGLGIDKHIGEKLFGIFERGSSEHAGHGLGLYIVLKHVKHLGGLISVVSYAKPTVFELRFPYRER